MVSATRNWRDVFSFYNGIFGYVLHHQSSGGKKAIVANAHGIVYGAVHAEETILSNGHSSAYNDVRRDEAIVVNF
jgi:predicted enzyme related to lactoylglutathione lyase